MVSEYIYIYIHMSWTCLNGSCCNVFCNLIWSTVERFHDVCWVSPLANEFERMPQLCNSNAIMCHHLTPVQMLVRGKLKALQWEMLLVQPAQLCRVYARYESMQYRLKTLLIYPASNVHMADVGGNDGGNGDANGAANDEGNGNDDEVNDDWATRHIGIATVHRVTIGKRQWFPEAQEHNGRIYITLTKADATLCLLVTGKAQNRHSKKEVHNLNVEWWQDTKQKSISDLFNILWQGLFEADPIYTFES